jgi:hypothetical protein
MRSLLMDDFIASFNFALDRALLDLRKLIAAFRMLWV